ncbi:MAG TPA: DUF1801 domain-containing protein [Pseudolysinimonas sp.]
MSVQEEIDTYIAGQPEAKRADLLALHADIQKLMPAAKLWFLDGRNHEGKVVSNPNIGYGTRVISYADGTTREFYQIGVSANSSGISVYVMGIPDKTLLPQKFGDSIGTASVTGYCIKFKALADIHLDVLADAIRAGLTATSESARN